MDSSPTGTEGSSIGGRRSRGRGRGTPRERTASASRPGRAAGRGNATYDVDDEACAAPVGAQACAPPTTSASFSSTVHHYHHQHCPTVPCRSVRPSSPLRLRVQNLEGTLRRLSDQVDRTQSRLRGPDRQLRDLNDRIRGLEQSLRAGPEATDRSRSSRSNSTPPPRLQRTLRRSAQSFRSTSRRRNVSPNWEPILERDPDRRRPRTPSPQYFADDSCRGPEPNLGNSPPGGCRRGSPSRRNNRAVEGVPQGLHVPGALSRIRTVLSLYWAEQPTNPIISPPGSPSRVGATLRARFSHFPERVLRNTRRFFFYHLLCIRESNPTLSAIVGFERFGALLVHAEYFTSANLVRRRSFRLASVHSQLFVSPLDGAL